jgi:outer membrane protein assembly factor BamB
MSYRNPNEEKAPLVVAFGGRVFGMDPETGERLWQSELGVGSSVRIVPFTDGLFVYTGTTLACLDLSTGRSIWSVDVSVGDTMLVDADRIFVGGGGEVRCYARANGRLLWEDTFRGMGVGAVALALGTAVAQADRIG